MLIFTVTLAAAGFVLLFAVAHEIYAQLRASREERDLPFIDPDKDYYDNQ